ncbi:ribonuclease III [Dehalococcoidia bacterium]|nr:ribonuclease III [Dehalococcoidia bacterium]
MTHSSTVHETNGSKLESNERLEFLGDAVLGLVVASWLFETEPNATEGELTKMRSELVRGSTISDIARTLQLGSFIQLGRGAEQQGGRDRDSILANTFESIIGALYLDQGVTATETFIHRVIDPIMEKWNPNTRHIDHKSHLQEILQAHKKVTPHYTIVETKETDNGPIFFAQVWAENNLLGEGQGRSKRQAELNAAEQALSTVQNGNNP